MSDASEKLKESWQDPDVRALRTSRVHVEVDGNAYRSVRAALEDLGLPVKMRQKIRNALRNGQEVDIDGHTFRRIEELPEVA